MELPLVGITCGTDIRFPKLSHLYLNAIESRGVRGVFISPERDVRETAARFSGFLIPGGRDLDPSLYGEEILFRNEKEEARRTEFEFALLDEIMRISKPVMGICYGMQAINVFLGGSLYQDIQSQVPQSLDHWQDGHAIEITENPFIENGLFEVNSSHHQGVKRLGAGAVSFAFAPDGVDEAFYLKGQPFCVGVQWHPERMESALSGLFFSAFAGACGAVQ